jgi:hypothetical protein
VYEASPKHLIIGFKYLAFCLCAHHCCVSVWIYARDTCMHEWKHVHACMNASMCIHAAMQARTPRQAYTDMNIHVCTWTYMNSHEHTCIHMNIHSCTWTYMNSHVHTCIHMSIHELTRIYMNSHVHTCMHMNIHTCTWTYTHAHEHTCIRMNIHELTRIYMHSHEHTYMHIDIRAACLILYISHELSGAQMEIALLGCLVFLWVQVCPCTMHAICKQSFRLVCVCVCVCVCVWSTNHTCLVVWRFDKLSREYHTCHCEKCPRDVVQTFICTPLGWAAKDDFGCGYLRTCV